MSVAFVRELKTRKIVRKIRTDNPGASIAKYIGHSGPNDFRWWSRGDLMLSDYRYETGGPLFLIFQLLPNSGNAAMMRHDVDGLGKLSFHQIFPCVKSWKAAIADMRAMKAE